MSSSRGEVELSARDREILRDVVRGYITAEDAARDYGVVVRGDPVIIDRDATERRRRPARP